MALVLSGSGLIPFSSILCPRKVRLALLNSHFYGFRVAPAFSIRVRTSASRVSCSAWSLPNTRVSSIRHCTPVRPERISLILRWKCTGYTKREFVKTVATRGCNDIEGERTVTEGSEAPLPISSKNHQFYEEYHQCYQ